MSWKNRVDDKEKLDGYWQDLAVDLFGRRPGPLECWEYTNCHQKSCIAYNIRPGDFYLYGQKARCGIPLYDESFGEYLHKMVGIFAKKATKVAVAPLAALLGR